MITLFGGLGLFLFGMMALTDGLKSFAGDRLRRSLIRFTDRPWRAFFSGFLVTFLVQSSGATTLATIGFVSAGLIPFAQSVGVVFGASLGTTGTSWLVSAVGLKFSLSSIALPVITVGALMRLVAKGRWRELGAGIAGFGLVFVGINYMQEGMGVFTEYFDPADFPTSGFGAHLLLVCIGFLMTLLTQSSSAAVAITLTALGSGVIVMEQAASMVIGQAVGTTMTAVMASFGASVAAKRTALAHVLFNLFSGVIALVCLPLFLWILDWMVGRAWIEAGPMSLAAFHTGFILLGVLIFLPLAKPFTRMIERILKEPKDQLTGNLDQSLLSLPAVALGALEVSVKKAFRETLKVMREGVDTRFEDMKYFVEQKERILQALIRQQEFLSGINPHPGDQEIIPRRLYALHALDHLERLTSRLAPVRGIRESLGMEQLKETEVLLRDCLSTAMGVEESEESKQDVLGWIERQAKLLERERDLQRPRVLEKTATGGMRPEEAIDLLDAIRWMAKVVYHLWRIQNYLYPVEYPRKEEATGVLAGEL